MNDNKKTITSDGLPKYLKAKDIAEILQISLPGAYALLNKGAFKVVRIGRSVRVPADGFFEWLEKSAG